jgi:hypothetical protein
MIKGYAKSAYPFLVSVKHSWHTSAEGVEESTERQGDF